MFALCFGISGALRLTLSNYEHFVVEYSFPFTALIIKSSSFCEWNETLRWQYSHQKKPWLLNITVDIIEEVEVVNILRRTILSLRNLIRDFIIFTQIPKMREKNWRKRATHAYISLFNFECHWIKFNYFFPRWMEDRFSPLDI